MKKKALIFVCMVLLALMIVPAINISLETEKKGFNRWSKAVLFNFDFALPYLNRILYPLGISTDSDQVTIGKDNWLYLGDRYENTLTVTRRGTTGEDRESSQKIGTAIKSWEQWLKLKGVRQFKIILGPNKSTIYPEFLPDWARPASASATDTLLANVSDVLYVDTRAALQEAKSKFSEPLYYKTDTHWNNLGAWVAFRAFAMELARTEAELKWFSGQQVHVATVNERNGGDLANFLWLKNVLRDQEMIVEIDTGRTIETEQYDFETGQVIASGGNPQIIAPMTHPVLIKSRNALNHNKVLWLRDSFGTAMVPFMSGTFSETLQLHYAVTDPNRLARLVDTYKPDYVFMTVVERSVFFRGFEGLPPTIVASGKKTNFFSLSHGSLSATNDLTKVEGTRETYQISGADPFLAFTLAHQIPTYDAPQLLFNLKCGEKKEPVPIQIFWHTANTIFNEANSVRITANPGINVIGLSPLSSWRQAGTVTDVRIDIDSSATCPTLSIDSLELGR